MNRYTFLCLLCLPEWPMGIRFEFYHYKICFKETRVVPIDTPTLRPIWTNLHTNSAKYHLIISTKWTWGMYGSYWYPPLAKNEEGKAFVRSYV